MSQLPEAPSVDAAWEVALDDLEQRLAAAEQLLQHSASVDPVTAWEPPPLDGPMPAHLGERARALLARQQDVIGQIPAASARLQQQRAVTGRISQAMAPANRPVYIDTSA